MPIQPPKTCQPPSPINSILFGSYPSSVLYEYVSNAQIYVLYVSMVFSKAIFSATYMEYIKSICPHSVSRVLSMHIPHLILIYLQVRIFQQVLPTSTIRPVFVTNRTQIASLLSFQQTALTVPTSTTFSPSLITSSFFFPSSTRQIAKTLTGSGYSIENPPGRLSFW
jgi:hypothetical protein